MQCVRKGTIAVFTRHPDLKRRVRTHLHASLHSGWVVWLRYAPRGGRGALFLGSRGGLPFGALSSRTCSLPSKERSPLLYFFVKSSITSITKADNSFATRCLWSDRWVIDVIEEVKKLLIIAGSLFAHCLFHRCSSSFAVSDNCCSSHVRLRTSAINQAPALSNSSSCVEQ